MMQMLVDMIQAAKISPKRSILGNPYVAADSMGKMIGIIKRPSTVFAPPSSPVQIH
jgi:hypothetical protein